MPARAALAGNPSDLYGGAVLAVPVRRFAAEVALEPSDRVEIDGPPGVEPLVTAALARLDRRARVRVRTTIPRTVGLAGSSAIVIATLRAAGCILEPLDLARLAQQVEADLGIPAGLQDRAVQASGVPVLLDVSGDAPRIDDVRPPAPIPLVVAWAPAAAGPSGEYHRRMANRVDRAGMRELASVAREAAGALARGDTDRLREAMAASAAVRDRVAPLPASHQALAAAVRRAGLFPSSTGSGGAVSAVVDDGADLSRLERELAPLGGRYVADAIV